MKPQILDLFCKAGGTTKGYQEAGFYVVGVDIEDQPNYCGDEFYKADALEALDHGRIGFGVWLEDFVGVHASPPCKARSTLRAVQNGGYEDLVDKTRELLIATGLPYIIENVVGNLAGSPLRNPIQLCGSSFGLGADGRQLRRHRLFECSFPAMALPCQHQGQPVGVYGTGGGGQMTRGYKARTVEEMSEALGIDWMETKDELSQAIPPAYTEHIGQYLFRHLKEPVTQPQQTERAK